MQLIKTVGEQAEVQFSTNEIITLNNALNEVCNGVNLVNFETKIGVSREQARILLDSIHKLVNELRSPSQSNISLQLTTKKTTRSSTIKRICTLETSGYQIVFYLRTLDYSIRAIGMIIVLAVEPGHEGVSGRSTATRIMIEDLLSLKTYFEQHIHKLTEDYNNKTNIVSNHYTPTFQIKALAGNVISENEGNFTIRFMVNVGRQEEKGDPSTYVSAESVVTFANIRSFTVSLQAAIDEFCQDIE